MPPLSSTRAIAFDGIYVTCDLLVALSVLNVWYKVYFVLLIQLITLIHLYYVDALRRPNGKWDLVGCLCHGAHIE